MSLQISKVILYGLNGEIREVSFRLGVLNILTGASKTGKSAVIDIVDYCMGKKTCSIADGVQRYTSWVAVQFEHGDQKILVARRSPTLPENTSGDVYIQRGTTIDLPEIGQLQKNMSVDDLRTLLSKEAGIRENVHVAKKGSTRLPLTATIRHALYLCIQDQNDIDHRSRLFHGQDDTFVANDIRHTIPYFLGAVSEERLEASARLEGKYRDRRALERKIKIESTIPPDDGAAAALFEEAKLVGLVAQSDQSEPQSVGDSLQTIARSNLDDSVQVLTSGTEQLEDLHRARQGLRNELDRIRREINEARVFSADHMNFEGAARQHRARLSSIQLFDHTPNSSTTCPICDSALDTPIPTVTQIRDALDRLNRIMADSEIASPRITEYIAGLTTTEQGVIAQLRDNSDLIKAVESEIDRVSAIRVDAVAQARVIGKIDQYIEMTRQQSDGSESESRLKALNKEISALEESLSVDLVQENVETFLGFVSDYITEYGRRLNLEYSETRLRLDLDRLTVVANTIRGAILMEKMGSGENWVGYHIAAYLALHRWFREQERPVPGFILFDQPSQAHYPKDKSVASATDAGHDVDEAAVKDVYRLLYDFPASTATSTQIIALDHPSFPEQWFRDSIVEEWRDGLGLLPSHWIVEDASAKIADSLVDSQNADQ